jgi:hypothetical protein
MRNGIICGKRALLIVQDYANWHQAPGPWFEPANPSFEGHIVQQTLTLKFEVFSICNLFASEGRFLLVFLDVDF